MDDHSIYLGPGKYDRTRGHTLLGIAIALLILSVILRDVLVLIFTIGAVFCGLVAWRELKTRKYEYRNWLGLRYLNTLHGERWKWGEGHERITRRFESASKREPKESEKSGEYLNIQDVETYGLSHFIERLRLGRERVDISALTQEQRANFVFDLRSLGTEFQIEAEKVKRTIQDSPLATQYQDVALFCQKEAKRMEQGGFAGISNEVSVSASTTLQRQVEELPNIGGSVWLMQQEGRVMELRFYGLKPGEYAITMSKQTKTMQFNDGAASISLAEFGVSPQAHGAFMIDAPGGTGDAVRW